MRFHGSPGIPRPSPTPRRLSRLRGAIAVAAMVAAMAVLPAILGCGPARAQCSIDPVATFNLLASGRPIIPITIEGRATTMMVDTGAEATSITPEMAKLLNLPRDPAKRSLIRTVGGDEFRPNALIRHLIAGPLSFGPMSVPVVSLDSTNTMEGNLIAGLVGMDLFGDYDLEVDLPSRRLVLYPRNACSPAEPPWPPGSYGTVDVVATRKRRLLLPVSLNGQTVVALLDTGAQGELLTRQAAERIGLSTMQIDSGPVSHGVSAGAHGYTTRLFHFDSFRVAGETYRNVTLPVSDFHQDGVDMLLGVNYMRSHRLYIALGAGRLFIQRADGRPVPGSEPPPGPVAIAMPAPRTARSQPGVAHCRAPATMLPVLSREVLQAVSRPRLPVPRSIQAELTEGCAGAAFRVAADGTVHDIHVVTEWPLGYGVGDYVRHELEATRFRPSITGDQALHFEAHRLHAK